ncbi:hypothetical protein CERZMDRAFT_102552 [Cercospora zeae-maydis SCOH1-5]|uniref:Uncharacterized protein n=1 Tax=Cercospora zeae-maydis SCOH1-5 TaxID=717836 RepID=A0A6A6F4I9_9PEZI|nr:hypothetical protein CERZMDRAFT_102552 [Cercospora zeae-maydis SCOH1-5]
MSRRFLLIGKGPSPEAKIDMERVTGDILERATAGFSSGRFDHLKSAVPGTRECLRNPPLLCAAREGHTAAAKLCLSMGKINHYRNGPSQAWPLVVAGWQP